MKKHLLIILLMILSIPINAQRDTEHWIAPYYASTANTAQALYLSTDSVTPFVVTVYSNNIVLGTVTISKGNPQTYVVSNANISATTASEAFAIINKGLYLNGEKPFYCTLRMVNSTQHAEILTSKGKAGIGKEFYVAATPSPFTSTGNSFTAGVLATENGTTVTATWSNTLPIAFIGATPGTNTHTFTLNKGQSFVFAGSGSPAANMPGFYWCQNCC